MGGLEKLLSEFKKRLEEQKGKHQKGENQHQQLQKKFGKSMITEKNCES